MIWRIGDRHTFQQLSRRGRRQRGAIVSVAFLPVSPPGTDDPTPPRVAFAISTKVGGAVVRNRIRRRLRAILRELSADPGLSSGAYLVSAGRGAADADHDDLARDLRDVLQRVGAEVGR